MFQARERNGGGPVPGAAAARVGGGGREGEAGTSEGAQPRELLSPEEGGALKRNGQSLKDCGQGNDSKRPR